MTKFIEVKDGIYINADEIEGIVTIKDAKKPDTACMVYTHHNNYPSTLPAAVIMNMMQTDSKDDKTEKMDKMLNIMKQETHFIG